MISISKDANVNYLAKIVKLKNLRKHENADCLQIATIDFQSVITGLDAKEGDIYCYFPVECQIDLEFLAHTNSFRHAEKNKDKEKVGFFEDKGRVKAMKLRGEKSMGYIVPIAVLEEFFGDKLAGEVGREFDTIGEKLVVKKYVIPCKNFGGIGRQGRSPKISRLVDKQVRLHVDTENLRKNAFKIKPENKITISYKIHGTSFWVGNLLVKRKLNLLYKFLRLVGAKVIDTEYDYIYGSRKVVKNEFETREKNHFYDVDIWGEIKDEIKDVIPRGYTLYGECVGYTKGGKEIQVGYDYGCSEGEKKNQIYRITFTNVDGVVSDLSSLQVEEFCNAVGLKCVHIFYNGVAGEMYKDISTADIEKWQEDFVIRLEKDYNDKDCFMCVNKVPEEGIVLRKETFFTFEAYKLKSFRFLSYESDLLDKGEVDMESVN